MIQNQKPFEQGRPIDQTLSDMRSLDKAISRMHDGFASTLIVITDPGDRAALRFALRTYILYIAIAEGGNPNGTLQYCAFMRRCDCKQYTDTEEPTHDHQPRCPAPPSRSEPAALSSRPPRRATLPIWLSNNALMHAVRGGHRKRIGGRTDTASKSEWALRMKGIRNQSICPQYGLGKRKSPHRGEGGTCARGAPARGGLT